MSPGPARVLEALRRANGPCSGEDLSSDLGVSRAQIWKHVEALRKAGYIILGEPGGGYQLHAVPDRLYPEEVERELRTQWVAREIEHLEETDSTNRVAAQRAQQGVANGYTVIAEAQSAGRARLGRSFYSPAHLNLYTSIVLRPTLTTAEAPTLIPAAAIAVAEAVAEELGTRDDLEIKWPNDVLLEGRKTCGILMEMQTEATRVGFAVLGIGVNLNVDPADFPEEFRPYATSLCAYAGRPIDRIAFAGRLYSILESVLDAHASGGFPKLRARFEALFRMPGKRIRVIEMNGASIEGIARGVDDDGALLVDREDGERVRVIAGDVTIAKEDLDR